MSNPELTPKQIERLQREEDVLDLWMGQHFTEIECKKINRYVEIQLLLEAECNK